MAAVSPLVEVAATNPAQFLRRVRRLHLRLLRHRPRHPPQAQRLRQRRLRRRLHSLFQLPPLRRVPNRHRVEVVLGSPGATTSCAP